jgi:hypothetical protein
MDASSSLKGLPDDLPGPSLGLSAERAGSSSTTASGRRRSSAARCYIEPGHLISFEEDSEAVEIHADRRARSRTLSVVRENVGPHGAE